MYFFDNWMKKKINKKKATAIAIVYTRILTFALLLSDTLSLKFKPCIWVTFVSYKWACKNPRARRVSTVNRASRCPTCCFISQPHWRLSGLVKLSSMNRCVLEEKFFHSIIASCSGRHPLRLRVVPTNIRNPAELSPLKIWKTTQAAFQTFRPLSL